MLLTLDSIVVVESVVINLTIVYRGNIKEEEEKKIQCTVSQPMTFGVSAPL